MRISKITKIHVATGITWVAVPEANLLLLCGCPADSVKHLKKRGLILPREERGCTFETGPNAILLSDVPIQGIDLANLAEFPVLQMLYKQGMFVPGHPGNTGRKPLLIGSANQVRSQLDYIHRGNYGLITAEEIRATGVSADDAREMMRLKRKFAFGQILGPQDFLDAIVLADEPVDIKNGVMIERTAVNQFRLTYGDECIDVDLNLAANQAYQVPFDLKHHSIANEHFAVIHSGEGDGWDCRRPCMGSVLVFRGQRYLIDAGPNILHSLEALGTGVNEIEGIFITHIHDDHFAGLVSVMCSDHRLKLYTTSLVRYSVAKKLSALVGLDETTLEEYFDVYDLTFDEWNSIDTLEVKPIFSPHPVETACFFFRAAWQGGYRTYAHLADTVSLRVLRDMITADDSQDGISREFYGRVKKQYTVAVQLKKVDIGGGLIHGDALDFRDDTSDKLVLSHTSSELTAQEKEIGSGVAFGTVDVLIPACQDHALTQAREWLQDCFPAAPVDHIGALLNCPIKTFHPEAMFLQEGAVPPVVYLILSGNVEAVQAQGGLRRRLSAGSFLGQSAGLSRTPVADTYRAVGFVTALEIPCQRYLEFLKQNGLFDEMQRLHPCRRLLQRTWLFRDMLTHGVQTAILRSMACMSLAPGQVFQGQGPARLHLLAAGSAERICPHGQTQRLGPGDYWGQEDVTGQRPVASQILAREECQVYAFPADLLKSIPIIRWKLFAASQQPGQHGCNTPPIHLWQR